MSAVPHWKTKQFFFVFYSTWSAFIIIMRLLAITVNIENKIVTNSLAFITQMRRTQYIHTVNDRKKHRNETTEEKTETHVE